MKLELNIRLTSHWLIPLLHRLRKPKPRRTRLGIVILGDPSQDYPSIAQMVKWLLLVTNDFKFHIYFRSEIPEYVDHTIPYARHFRLKAFDLLNLAMPKTSETTLLDSDSPVRYRVLLTLRDCDALLLWKENSSHSFWQAKLARLWLNKLGHARDK